jgi:hypothetical protein
MVAFAHIKLPRVGNVSRTRDTPHDQAGAVLAERETDFLNIDQAAVRPVHRRFEARLTGAPGRSMAVRMTAVQPPSRGRWTASMVKFEHRRGMIVFKYDDA